MKKDEKMKLFSSATERINDCIKAEKLQDVDIKDILTVMPGGKSLDALFIAARALHKTPGMRMGDLQDFVCACADLNFANAGWVSGRVWGEDKPGFGGLGLLWERRKERHQDDKRTVWHYYLLPPGRALAESDIDPREKMIKENLKSIEIIPKPGDLLTLRLYTGGQVHESNYYYAHLVDPPSLFPPNGSEIEPSVNIVVGYAGDVVKMKSVTWRNKLYPTKVLVTASGPDSPDWKDVIRSRTLFIICMGSGHEMLAINATSITGVKTEDE